MRRLLTAAVLVAAVASCSGSDDAGPPPTTRATTTSTTAVDRSGVALPGVAGETTTTVLEVGTARLIGTVRGPAGPLAGATVQADRLAGDRQLRREVVAGPDGRWELPDVPGGRYRVRAFLAPTHAQTTAEVRFLADGAEHTFDLVAEEQRGVVVRSDAAPDQPYLGDPVNLVVLVALRTVSPDGVVRSTTAAGTVDLLGLGRWVLRDDSGGAPPSGSSTSLQLSGGQARVELECVAVGDPGLVLQVPVAVPSTPSAPSTPGTAPVITTAPPPLFTVETVALDLPACIEVPPTTSTSTTATSTAEPPPSTTG